MKKEEILAVLGEVYVGYNPLYTLDTALATATRRFNDHLKTQFSVCEVKEMMKNENVIACGGLDNYMVKAYKKMAESKVKENELEVA